MILGYLCKAYFETKQAEQVRLQEKKNDRGDKRMTIETFLMLLLAVSVFTGLLRKQ